MAAKRYANPGDRVLDSAGNLLSNGKLYFYSPGTETEKAIYTTSALSVERANPVILSGTGLIPEIWLDGAYDVVLKNQNDVLIDDGDNINLASATLQITDWSAAVNYSVDDLALGTDGLLYISLTANNLNNNPVGDDGTNWALFNVSVTDGITAGTTQSQAGATALTSDINEVSTCANANDGVKLPTAVKGRQVVIINNGAEDLKIWPADSDKIDGGSADAADANVLGSGDTRTYVATDNENWYAEGAASSSGITRSARTSNTILAAADRGVLIDFTGSSDFTQTITDAATLGDGWFFPYKNSGTATITLDPNGSETIDGETTVTLVPGDAGVILCDGSNFHRANIGNFNQQYRTLISTTTLSSDATAEFVFPGDFDYYELELVNVVPGTDTRGLFLRTSSDGGSTFDSGGVYDNYQYGADRAGNSVDIVTTGNTSISLITELGNAAGENGASGILRVFNPSAAAACHIQGHFMAVSENGNTVGFTSGGRNTNAADVDALQLLFNTGNLQSGTVYFWGVRRGV